MGFRDFIGTVADAAWIMSTKDTRKWADKGCGGCDGLGTISRGLRPFPGQRGQPLEVCGCVQANRKAHIIGQRAETKAPAVEQDPDPAGIALLERQLFGRGDPAAEAKADAHAKARVERDTASGELTLCCKRYCCICGENLRLWNGIPRKYPGTMLPGSVDEQRFHEAKAQYEGQQNAQNADQPTLELPLRFGGDF